MEASTAAPSQYHHYVPQFLLKNFAHKYKPPKRRSAASTTQSNRKAGKRLFKGDFVLNYVDLSLNTPELKEIQVKRVFGQTNMYKDATKPYKEQHRVERMLSRLESDTSTIFNRIKQSFDKGLDHIWLTRIERNLIRKFLFLMKYRSSTFHSRFYHDLATDYDSNDRESLLKYMQEKGFVYPMDVWLHNIQVVIDLDMDDELKWISELPNRMYPDDAEWAIAHMQSMYMAICTPSDPKDEFLLTDNSYRIFEGPSESVFHPSAGVIEGGKWFNFHEFAPISPRLMVVLRSFILPERVDDNSRTSRLFREEAWSLVVEKEFGSETNSVLADLPVCKPVNNYTQLVNETLRLLPDQDGSLKSNHKFCFRFFPISTAQLNRINALFLENASSCDGVVYDSEGSFRNTLEFFLTEPCQSGKRVSGHPNDPRLQSLRKLADVLKRLGSGAEPVWDEIDIPELDDKKKERILFNCQRKLLPMMLDHIPDDNPTEFMKVYFVLGGSKRTIQRDMEQSRLMINLRIKIDVWSKGIGENFRQKNRDDLIDAYLQLPRRRVWFYLKSLRNMMLRGPNPLQGLSDFKYGDPVTGPEDIIAKSWRVIEPKKLNWLMYFAVHNDISMRMSLGFNPWPENAFSSGKLEGFRRPQEILFRYSIQDCGIGEVEEASKAYGTMLRVAGTYRSEAPKARSLDENQMIELMTRAVVRNEFKNILGNKLKANMREQLATIFFELVFPTIE